MRTRYLLGVSFHVAIPFVCPSDRSSVSLYVSYECKAAESSKWVEVFFLAHLTD